MSRSNCTHPDQQSPSSHRCFAMLAVLIAAALSVGCASTLPTLESQEIYRQTPVEQSGLIVKTVAEGERVMLIKSPDDLEKVCSPRESDEGLSFSKGWNVSIPTEIGTVGAGDEIGDGAVALGEPSDLVQLAREMIFRACELTLNLDADAEQTVVIYDRFLSAFERIAASFSQSSAEGDDDKDSESASDDGGVADE